MPLKIVRAAEPMPIANIVLTVYAQPGLGKSTLGFTADKPLLLDFDKGAYRAAKRGDSVPVRSWADVQEMAAADLAEFNTVIVDTAGRALDSLAADIIAGNPKAGRGDGSLSLQGFGTLKSRFAQWQGFLRSLNKDLVLICHLDEQKQGDETIERIDAQGASKNEIYKSSDAMCRIRLDGRDGRYLDFNPRAGGYGKNPAQLPQIPFPHPSQNPHFLADVIAQIKGSINKITADQGAAVKESQEWEEALKEVDTVMGAEAVLKLARERKSEVGIALAGRKVIDLAAKASVAIFNSTALPLMKEFADLKKYGADAAKAKGFKADKTSGTYQQAA